LTEGLAQLDTAKLADQASRLSPAIQPMSQRVNLKLDPVQEAYSGSTQLTLQALTPTSLVQFHSSELEISSIELLYQGQTFYLTPSSSNKFDIV
jgi:hypothetical protein